MRLFTHCALAAVMAAATLTASGCQIYFAPPDEDPGDPPPPPPWEEPPPPPPWEEPPPGDAGWIAHDFETAGDPGECTGERFVRYAPAYDRWVGAILCGSAERYKLYLGARQDDLYFEIADYAGHGQDHCELVNPDFSLLNEDDITSGGCATCALGELVDLIGVPVYARGYFGETFDLTQSVDWADLSTTWYECGVAISANPNPPAPSPFEWKDFAFQTFDGIAYCDGKRYVRHSPEYGLWVGAEVCEEGLYKLYLGGDENGTFYEIADTAGYGQDHCELVNPNFRLPSEDDITSGGCDGCAIGELIDLIDVPVYVRSVYGESFALTISTDWADLTTAWYRCGVSIP
ncbi:MAG TPA: hypothetical protein VNM90_17620 [Haliangium sp.]|nr:hypothetical protein [Haliangium sp.]